MSLADKDFLLEMHQPRWTSSWVWVGFVVSFFTLQGALGIALFWGWWWLALPAIPVLAHLMHAHLVAFHEASHGTLCPNPRVLNQHWVGAPGLRLRQLRDLADQISPKRIPVWRTRAGSEPHVPPAHNYR